MTLFEELKWRGLIKDITVEDMGVAYTDPSTCKDELSLSLIQGLCDVLEERVVGDKRVLHLELNKESLLK